MTLDPTVEATVETAAGATMAAGIELQSHHHIPEPGEPLTVLDAVDDTAVEEIARRRVTHLETAFVREDTAGGAEWRQQITVVVADE